MVNLAGQEKSQQIRQRRCQEDKEHQVETQTIWTKQKEGGPQVSMDLQRRKEEEETAVQEGQEDQEKGDQAEEDQVKEGQIKEDPVQEEMFLLVWKLVR